MSNAATSHPQDFPENLPIMAVLGLSDEGDIDWSRVRGKQYEALSRLTFARVYLQAMMSVFVAQLYLATLEPTWVLGWMTALALVQTRAVRIERDFADAGHRHVSSSQFLEQSKSSMLSGLLWAAAIVFFAPEGTIAQFAALLVVTMVLMAGSVYFYTTAPLSIIGFTMIVAAAGLFQALSEGLYALGAALAVFTALTIMGAIAVARVYLRAQLAENTIGEKEEAVSLLLREFEENEADWLWEIDSQRRLHGVSPRFAFALEAVPHEVEGRSLLTLLTDARWSEKDVPPSFRELADHVHNRDHFTALTVEVFIKGQTRFWELSGAPMHDERGRYLGMRGVGSDVTQERRSSEKINYLARYDTLTALPNRLMLSEALEGALTDASRWRSRCALMMIDLDRFKAINEALGHGVGDKLLAQVSARLQSLVKDEAMVGRLGGDEFAIVLRDADWDANESGRAGSRAGNRPRKKGEGRAAANGPPQDGSVLDTLARRVIERLSEPYHVDHHTLHVGASVGSAIGPRDGTSVEELMRNADLALYQAKDMGGGEHRRFEPVLHASAEERRQLEGSLREALGLDEFVLHFQPVVDATSENIVSFEALVRWNSPEHGFVSPGRFIPLAENTRLIVPIGRWVLRQACQEAKNWPDHVRVNVNVSPEQLLEPDFHQEVSDALTASGLEPERLEVEVTESIFVRDAGIAQAALEKIMELGCSIALDDFGTGYSSLGYLRQLSFSTIKVDRTFVQGAAQGSNESLAIINAVVAMAKNMNMTTVAEGVEDAEEAALIRKLGCDKIQGFYFGRPMSSADARRLFIKDVVLKSA